MSMLRPTHDTANYSAERARPLEVMRKQPRCLAEKVRVSSGSAIVLGLIEGFLDAKPTTAYLLTFLEGKCTANCHFCSQAKDSESRADMLSRVAWPVFQTEDVVSKLAAAAQKKRIMRVCIQALNYPRVVEDLCTIVRALKSQGVEVPVSISCQPLKRKELEKLAETGVERIGIPLDAATKDVFNRIKGSLANGPYDWDAQRFALLEAVKIFGVANVSTHLMVGLGETEEEMVQAIQWCVDNHIYPALFAFTPIPGTALEQQSSPPLDCYRRIQLARYLIVEGQTSFEKLQFDECGRLIDFGVHDETLGRDIQSGRPFQTSGCPECNRPYYNEKPSGPLYNFPFKPAPEKIKEIEKQLNLPASRSMRI